MHPILFEIPMPWGHQPIYAYGVLLGLSLFVGWQITFRLGKQVDISAAATTDVYLTAALTGLLGARLLYVLLNRDEFSSSWQWLDLRSGGLVAYGGLLGGFAGAALHQRIKQASLLNLADAAAPAIAVGVFLTRVGCYLYGCDFGTRLSDGAPQWLQRLGRFPRWPESWDLRGAPAWLHHVESYGLARESAYSLPVHPTQLYEAAVGLALAVLCLLVFQRRAFVGQVLLVLCIGYGVARFFLEYVRDDPERGEAFGFSTSQLFSLCVVPVAVVAYSVLRKPATLFPSSR